MQKPFFFLILLGLILAISACSPTTPEPSTATLALPSPTTEPPTASAEPTAEPSIVSEPGCTVVSIFPPPDPSEQDKIPPPSANDWSHGAQNASVTLIEYGDFQ